MTRAVVWLSTEPMERTLRGYASATASQRYRMAIPSAALQALGWDSEVRFFGPDTDHRRLLGQMKGVDAVVVGKLWYPPEMMKRLLPVLLKIIATLRGRGVKVLADFCDYNLDDPLRGPADVRLANEVDVVVTCTPQLGEMFRGLTAARLAAVSDPVEGTGGAPRLRAHIAGRPLSLLWFGHSMNLPTLFSGLQQLEQAAAQVPFSLTAVTKAGPGKEAAFADLDRAWASMGRSCRFRPWSVQAVFDELAECDAVIIPSDPRDPAKLAKSPNRFTEAVWAGRFVLAHPLPAYESLAESGWVGEDLASGLRWLAEHPAEALARIHAGQAMVRKDYSPEAIGRAWLGAIEGE